MKPLLGRRILVTRPAAQAETLAALIEAQGGEPIRFPLLEISPADDLTAFRNELKRLDTYALAIFISPNAVDFSLPAILAQGPWPGSLPAAAIGPGTVAQLASYGIEQVIAPTQRFDSEALLELPELQAEQLGGKKVLILRGNGGRTLLADTLRARGAEVVGVACYQRSSPTDMSLILSLLRAQQLDAITLSSSEGLRYLLDRLEADDFTRLRAVPVFVPHSRIAAIANDLGLPNVVLTDPADAGIIAGLCAYNWPPHA